jgi:RimJ/RimL family protein N-acetyltransferase
MYKTVPDQFESKRFLLRRYRPGDGKMYYAAGQRNRDHLAKFEAGNAILSPKNENEAEKLVQELADLWTLRKCFFLGIFEKASQDWVGQIYIGVVNWEAPEFELGYIVGVERQGQGIITESVCAALRFLFVDLNAHRVRLECDDTNERSYRVAERAGFVREGHLRQDHLWPGGEFTGTYLYGLLKNEYVLNQQDSNSQYQVENH